MRFGIVSIVDGEPGRRLDYVHDTARTAEELGYSCYYAPDHVVFFDRYDSRYPHSEDGRFGFKQDQGLYEPMMVLQAAAEATEQIRLGTSVEILSQRNPVIRAREITTIDHFSGGRFDYGVGVGWAREEHEALGVPFERRGARADEYLEAMKALWTQDRATYTGEFVDFEQVIAFPKPIQTPHPPILVGGVTRAALRRVARHGDGWYGWKLQPDELDECLDMLDEELAHVGRDRDDVKLYLGTPVMEDFATYVPYVREVAKRGIEQFVFGVSLSRSRYAEQLADMARQLALPTP